MAVQLLLSNALFLPTSASLLPRSLYRRRRCDADTDETYPRWWALSLPTLGLLGEGGRSTPGTAQLCAPHAGDPGKTVKERPVDVADGNIGRPRPKDNDTNDDDCPSR